MPATLTPQILAAKLQHVSQGVHRRTVAAMKTAALNCEARAKKYATIGQSPYDSMIFPTKKDAQGNQRLGAPYDLGALRNSITSKVSDDGMKIKGTIGTNMSYARFVEFGTSKMQGRPFVRKSRDDETPETTKLLREATKESLGDALL